MNRVILMLLAVTGCGLPVNEPSADGGHPAKLGEACQVDSDCGSELRCVTFACQVK